MARRLESAIRDASAPCPIVTVTGPRQAGKTPLCHALFPAKRSVNLEALDLRDYASRDPRGFLAEHSDGALLDEVQRVPERLSDLHVEVDARPDPGCFI